MSTEFVWVCVCLTIQIGAKETILWYIIAEKHFSCPGSYRSEDDRAGTEEKEPGLCYKIVTWQQVGCLHLRKYVKR